jgi:short-subunit dehydrogenase
MGIGWELAKGLARDGYRVILAARGEEALKKAAVQLAESGGGEPFVFPVDLAHEDGPKRLFDFAAGCGLPIDVLVNSAGFGAFRPFADDDLESATGMVRLNVLALTALTRLVVPGMIERKRGRILNVSSTAAFQPGPYMAVYFASKAYVLHFSEALAHELRKTGVTVTCLCPGPTKTPFVELAKMDRSGLTAGPMMTAEAVARAGLRGLYRGQAVVIPGAWNKVLAFSPRFVPRSLATRLAGRLTKGRETWS